MSLVFVFLQTKEFMKQVAINIGEKKLKGFVLFALTYHVVFGLLTFKLDQEWYLVPQGIMNHILNTLVILFAVFLILIRKRVVYVFLLSYFIFQIPIKINVFVNEKSLTNYYSLISWITVSLFLFIGIRMLMLLPTWVKYKSRIFQKKMIKNAHKTSLSFFFVASAVLYAVYDLYTYALFFNYDDYIGVSKLNLCVSLFYHFSWLAMIVLFVINFKKRNISFYILFSICVLNMLPHYAEFLATGLMSTSFILKVYFIIYLEILLDIIIYISGLLLFFIAIQNIIKLRFLGLRKKSSNINFNNLID